MRIFLIALLLIGPVLSSFGQFGKKKNKPVTYKRHYNEILPAAPQCKKSGWILGPGATHMLTPFVYQGRTFDETATSKFDARARGIGKPGLYAEVGRYQMLEYSKLFKYFDYGISYEGLRGNERANGQYVSIPDEAVLSPLEESRGSFGYHYAQGFFNLNNVVRISKYNFIQNSIGVNAGYAFLANLGGTGLSPADANQNPGRIQAQLHYKIGFGIKMRGNWLIIPALETPILNGWKWENGRSSHGFFASRYRPIIFSLRFFFIRNANTLDCTPVKTREGLMMPTDMNKQQQMDQTK